MTSETKTCQNCTTQFTIAPEDFAFYERIKVPPPTWCPGCRLQRRLAWRNERALYRRVCTLCSGAIVAMYPPDTEFPVYCRLCWFSDKWDPLSYARDYDFSRSFFEQFRELQRVVPRIALQADKCENCDFANQIGMCKNSYLITSSTDCEDCYYSHRVLQSRDVFDSLQVQGGERCYEAIECLNSSVVRFSSSIADTMDVQFCHDVRGTQHGFMSANKRSASYVFRNAPISKEMYTREMEGIDTGSFQKTEEYKKEFAKMCRNSLRRFARAKNAVNFTGDTAHNVKNCYHCFNIGDAEDCRYCIFLNDAKDTMDVNNGCCTMELCYEACTVGVNAARVLFSVDAWPEITDACYVDSCRNSARNVFGCNAVRGKQYCILNKQYSKEDYEALLPKIIRHMNDMPYSDKKGREYRYGEFFPAECSPFAYNETVAQEYFPLTKDKAAENGYRWRDVAKKDVHITRDAADLPDHIDEATDDVLRDVVGCFHHGTCNEQCTVGFRIIPQELAFYRAMRLPLPRLCPNCGHANRIKQRNPLQLWHRQCTCAGTQSDPSTGSGRAIYLNTSSHFHATEHCPNEFETSYAPGRPEIVYCESCYNNEIA